LMKKWCAGDCGIRRDMQDSHSQGVVDLVRVEPVVHVTLSGLFRDARYTVDQLEALSSFFSGIER